MNTNRVTHFVLAFIAAIIWGKIILSYLSNNPSSALINDKIQNTIETTGSNIHLSSINLNPFSINNQEPKSSENYQPVQKKKAIPKAPQSPKPLNTFKYQGFSVDANGRSHAIIQTKSGRMRNHILLGDTIQNFLVHSIYPDSIILSKDKNLFVIYRG